MSRFYRFAEKAIETAGEVGAEKRKDRRLSEIRKEAGLTERHKMTQAGKETQHKREYGAPGIGDPGGFRYAELAAKKEAGTRLSVANQAQNRKQQLEAYDINTEALFSPHMQYGPEGEAMMPPQLRNIYNAGRAMALNDPEGAQKYIKSEVAAYTKSAKQATRKKELGAMSPEQFSAYEQSLLGGGQAGGAVLPSAAASIVSPAPATTLPRATHAEALAGWAAEEGARKKRFAEHVGTPPAYIKPWGAIKRSFTKPIDRERLGGQVDYTRLFGSQQGR